MKHWFGTQKHEVHWLDYQLQIQDNSLNFKLPNTYSPNYPLDKPQNISQLSQIETNQLLFARYYEFNSKYLKELLGTFAIKLNIYHTPDHRIHHLDDLWQAINHQLHQLYDDTNLTKQERGQLSSVIEWPLSYHSVELENCRHPNLHFSLSGGTSIDKWAFPLTEHHHLQLSLQSTSHHKQHQWKQHTTAIQHGLLNSLTFQPYSSTEPEAP